MSRRLCHLFCHLPSLLRLGLLSCLAWSLTACSPNEHQELGIDSSDNANAEAGIACQTHDTPFAYSACQVEQHSLLSPQYRLALFWKDAQDSPLLSFAQMRAQLPSNQQLLFSVNAGMYNTEFAPIGYTVIEGKQIRALNLNEGGGNFHLLPNGVFWWDEHNVHISESQHMARLLETGDAKPEFATQSGPMLVIDGRIHPKFDPDSQSKKFRNGVGVCGDADAPLLQFVISDEPVNFYQFAQLFQAQLQCDNALFLDGGIASAMYAPSLKRQDSRQMGVMIGLLEQEQP